ncbi:MAG: DUF4145 domain-containing protein [Bryobacteraceae bacterium]|nr:DUF4145 domain-containing protein [Bryobacteraceae bacterium]
MLYLVFPSGRVGPAPNPDLPEDIRLDFEEARIILNQSPRGAAALLRLCIQKLCAHLGEPGRDLNLDIRSLVRKGLPIQVQRALDVVRVVGNEAVHPGTMDLRDNTAIALKLLDLVNYIAEKMISEPKKHEALFNELPETKRQPIEKRDLEKS